MPIVMVPGHGDVEFPDSMKDEEIVAAIKKLSAPKPEPRQVGYAETALRSVAHGATLGFGDELEAGWKSLLGQGKYKDIRDQLRGDEAAARAQNPKTYLVGELLGGAGPGVAATLLTGGAASPLLAGRAAAGMAAGQGAVQGAGYSDAGDARSLAGDTALGGGLGLAGHAVASALGTAGQRLAGYFRGKGTAATAKAAEQAAEEVADKLQTAKSQFGAEVQKGSRQIENVTRLEPAMTPAQQAELAAQRSSGAVPQLEQRVAQSTLEAMPSQAATIAAKEAELAAQKRGASAAFQARKEELLQPQFGKDAASFFKSYGEPLVWGGLGAGAGHMMGLSPGESATLGAVAGSIGGRTRAGKALLTRLSRPGNQKAIMDALETAADSLNTTPGALLRQLLARGGATAATQQLVTP